jgi:hypothetical protein
MRRSAALPYAVLIAVWAVSVFLWMVPGYMRPDGAGYTAYLPSAFMDHDLVLFDEWARLGMIRGNAIAFTEVTPNGHLSDHWTVGPAVAWLPAYAAADAARAALPMLRGFARNGFSLPYTIAIVASSAMAGLAALLLGVNAAVPVASRFAATLAAIGVWFGSPLLWYSVRHATMGHAVSAAACAVVVAIALSLRRELTASRIFAAGLACGFAFAVRPQNLTFVLVPMIVAGSLPLLRRSWLAAIGFVIGCLPELVVSQILYGRPLAFASSGGANDWHSFERIRPFLPLVSWYHGMFPWTPLLALSLIGLLLLWRDDRRLAAAGIVTFVLQWSIIAAFDRSFWGMLAFGQRRFDSCTIFFLIGLAAMLARLPRWLAAIVVAAGSVWTMLLYFAAGHLSLNQYIPPRTLWDAALFALRHDDNFQFLQFVPPQARAAAFVMTLIAIAIFALAALAVRAHAAVAAAYLIAVSALLAWCGSHDADNIAQYRPFIEANRRAPNGHALDYLGLLRLEAAYFQSTGNDAEAAVSRRDEEAFARAHGLALTR